MSVTANYSKYIPLASIFLLLCAIIEEGLYYGIFGIDIFSYLNISELVSLFVSSIPILLLISLTTIIYIMILNAIVAKKFPWVNNSNRYNRKLRRKYDLRFMIITAIIFVIWILHIAIIPRLVNPSIKAEVFHFGKLIIYFIGGFWLTINFLPLPLDLNDKLTVRRLLILSLGIFVSAIYFKTTTIVFMLKENPSFRTNIELKLKEGRTITSNDSLIYLGKTKDYFFFHTISQPKSKTIIIKAEEVNNIAIDHKVGWYIIP